MVVLLNYHIEQMLARASTLVSTIGEASGRANRRTFKVCGYTFTFTNQQSDDDKFEHRH